MFDWNCTSHLQIFHSSGEVIITGEGFQILTYDRHPWPLSNEGSLACHTYCDASEASVYNGHFRGPVTLTPIAECSALELSLPVFTTVTKVCSCWDSNTQPPAGDANALTHCATAVVITFLHSNWIYRPFYNTTTDFPKCRVKSISFADSLIITKIAYDLHAKRCASLMN